MLSLKWKLFRVISYLHLVISLFTTIVFIYTTVNGRTTEMDTVTFVVYLILLFFLVMSIVNGCINLYVLEKNYPDVPLTKSLRILSILLFIFSLLAILSITGVTIVGVVSIVTEPEEGDDSLGTYLAIAVLGFIIVTSFYILWNQVSLRKAIRRNYDVTINSFLEGDQL